MKKFLLSTLINIFVVITISFTISSTGVLVFLFLKLTMSDIMKDKLLKKVT